MSQVFAVVTKNPNAVLDFTLDWSTSYLQNGETISTSSWTVPSGITKDSDTNDTTSTTITLSGGTLGEDYDLVNTVTTSASRTETRTLRVSVAYKSTVDRVRFLVGDTDSTDEQATDNDYLWALSEANDNVYKAAAIVARGVAAKYGRRVDMTIEGVSTSYGQLQEHYTKLAVRMEAQAAKYGGSLGVPLVGGISRDEMQSVREDTDRVRSAFRRGMFENPERGYEDDYEID